MAPGERTQKEMEEIEELPETVADLLPEQAKKLIEGIESED